jgi:hypothetical protein
MFENTDRKNEVILMKKYGKRSFYSKIKGRNRRINVTSAAAQLFMICPAGIPMHRNRCLSPNLSACEHVEYC